MTSLRLNAGTPAEARFATQPRGPVRRCKGGPVWSHLRDVLADVLCQYFVDERLVAHTAAPRFLAEPRRLLIV